MKTKTFCLLAILLVGILALSACAKTVSGKKEQEAKETVVVEKERAVEKEVTKAVVKEVTKVVEKEAVPPQATPAPKSAGQPGDQTGTDVLPDLYRVNRMIVKDAELRLLVEETSIAVDLVTQVAADTMGYIISSRTWYQDTYQYATITIGVPVDEFEGAMRRLRGLAIQVLDENASGTDVSDQYVDLESRLRNLEATEARIRSFLDQAKTVEESLRVNQTLSEITDQIEEIKGKMNYLKDRAAYSTITVSLEPQVPTPTPTPTSTPTFTPTPTETPTPTPTPEGWRPGKTFASASKVLTNIVQNLVDAAIWIIVVLGPFAIPAALAVWIIVVLDRRRRKESGQKGSASAPKDQ